ncbi:Tn3 family transposase [Streptomyces asoensis]|uniref:Tn3 family transposase n=1 Tax=Streptomyces asoensis TaxID=249586 RepID=UPI0033D11F72
MIGPSPSSSVRSGRACVARRAGQNWIIPSARAPPARASLGTAETEQVLRRFTGRAQAPDVRAIEELVRAVRTSFVCDYLSDVEMHQKIPPSDGARPAHPVRGDSRSHGVTPGDLSGGSDEFGGQSAGAAGFPFLLGSRRGDPFPSIRCAAGQQSGEYEQKFPGRSNHLLPDQTFINSSRPDLPFFPAVAAEERDQ